MVTLSTDDKKAITEAVTAAERRMSAEIVMVVTPASDTYQRIRLLCGFALGSAVALALWFSHATADFLWLLAAQLAATALLCVLPPQLLPCLPRALREHRAAQRAFAEFASITQKVAADVPVIMLFVSLAEHYAHILADRKIRGVLPDAVWDDIIAAFTRRMRMASPGEACVEAIRDMADRLAPHFPYAGQPHVLNNDVIERP
jgi:putative membrane protein